MLALCLLSLIFDSIYFALHQTPRIYLLGVLSHVVIFGLINFFGSIFLYRPIADLFAGGGKPESAKYRIERLAWYSCLWIFLLGVLFIVLYFSLMAVVPTHHQASVETFKIPPILFLTFIPSILFFQAIFPAFITYFLINDFTLDLKARVFRQYAIPFTPGKKKIAQTLVAVFVVLVFFPSILVILELGTISELGAEYAKFTDIKPVATAFVDRFVGLVGMIFAIVLINRSFTKPIHSLLSEMAKVRGGDFSNQAAIVTGDEIGVLTQEFNQMVKGLQERELIRDTFGKYVNQDVASVILNKKINLEGEVRTCTILVTDIANYTTLSEKLSPREIVRTLNEYFSVLVKIIQNHQGVVNKYMGDSIFAMFNVPLDDPEHAVHAVQAALEIDNITRSTRFGNNLTLTTRIGINTGTVVAGNIGSADRIEYTVIGDEVNVAARLEQLNKEHGTRILVGKTPGFLLKSTFHSPNSGISS